MAGGVGGGGCLDRVAAVPGYVLAIAKLDKIGHRRLQLLGFAMMAACFAVIALVPGMTTMVVPFLLVYGVSYFFTEFGPNMTTFVMPSELYPVTMRATGHGISAGIGKLGAFIGVFLFPLLNDWFGLRGTLLLTAGVAVAGFALTLVLPEPAGRSLEDMATSTHDTARPLRVAGPRPLIGRTQRYPVAEATDEPADRLNQPIAGINPIGVVPAPRPGGCLALAPQKPARAVT